MSTSEVFKQFFAKLAKSLPMDDPLFVAELFSHDLLPGDHYDQIESRSTRADKAVYFLNHVIKPAMVSDVGSFNELLKVMEDSEYCNVKELAQQIVSNLSEGPVIIDNTTATTETNSSTSESLAKTTKESTALDVAADELRATYQTQSSPAQNDWPNYCIAKYVRLALVEKPKKTYRADHEHHIGMLGLRGGIDKIQEERRQLNFDDLSEMFCNSNDRMILIMGGPGIGKTTLASEICVKWARDEFISKAFHIVILLLLRSIQQQSTEQVFEELIGKEAFQELTKSRGTKCLIILEGLDEITLERQQSDSILTKLINSKMLQYSKIVVTSRPHACQELMKKANKIIEILGFGVKEITEFVQDSFSLDNTQSGEVFLQQLEEHPQLYSLCHVPISLAMIIDIFKESRSLPSTLTELYYRFMVMMLVREHGKVKEKSVSVPVTNNVEEILHRTLPDVPKEKLGNICLVTKLAFYGFFAIDENNKITERNPKIIFVQNDLIQCGIVNTDNYDGHSLLKMETLHHFAGGQMTFNFIHLTIQEFLCAVYMLTLSQEEQYHLLNEYFDDYPNIMVLYCGLTKLNFFHQVVSSKLTTHHSTVTAVKCLYEGQQNIAPHIKSLSPFVLNMSGITLLPYDCHCLSYVLCHYPVTQLKLTRCHIGDKNVGILAKWCYTKKNTELQELDLISNNLTNEGMKHVMKIMTSSLSLRVLDVSFNNIEDDGISLYLQYIDTLTELTVWKCGLSVKGPTYIKKMLMESNNLAHLNIGNNDIGNDGVRHITEGLQQNVTLIHLELPYCNITVKGATYIKKMLMENNNLTHLNISDNDIGNDGVRHVTEGLQQNVNLTQLRLNNCKISVKGAISISEMIKINHTLQLLNISENPIGDEGIAAIATNLKNSMISKLYVWRCKITVTGAKSLAGGLVSNDTLKSLTVFHNDITVNGTIAILEAAVSNNVCEEAEIDNKYKSDDKVKEMMSILEERKRQEESKTKSKDEHVTMTTEDHHGNTSVKDDQP